MPGGSDDIRTNGCIRNVSRSWGWYRYKRQGSKVIYVGIRADIDIKDMEVRLYTLVKGLI